LTRVAFISDLHIDHHLEVVDRITEQAVAREVDVLVVAGDVSPRIEHLREVLVHLRAHVPRVAYVPGNHDLWCGDDAPDSRDRYVEALPAMCVAARVDYLPAGPVVLPGVTLVGQTGWYDYSLRDPALDDAIPMSAYERGTLGPLSWSDKKYVVWPGVDDRDLTALMVERLRADLDAAPRDRPAFVVTHMLPFADLVSRRPLPWGFIAGFLGAASLGEAIVQAAEGGLDVSRAVCGHTHFRREAVIQAGGRSFTAETSPVGYPREVKMTGAASLADHIRERLRVVSI
jgi:predicted phosphohydrolase